MRKFEKNENIFRYFLIFGRGDLGKNNEYNTNRLKWGGGEKREKIFKKVIKFGHVKSITCHKFHEIFCADLEKNIKIIQIYLRPGGSGG